jgi:hypothetical protein
MTPRNDIDEEVIWLGTGAATPIDGKVKKPHKRNPIGFIWPSPATRKPRAVAKRRSSPGRKKR